MMDESFTFPSKDFMAKDVELNSLPLHDQLKVDDLFLQDDLQVTQKFTSYCLVFSIVYSGSYHFKPILNVSIMKNKLIEAYPLYYTKKKDCFGISEN